MDVFKACVAALCVDQSRKGVSLALVSGDCKLFYRAVLALRGVSEKAAGMLEVGLDELEPEALEKADQRALYALMAKGIKRL
ncbi:MAG: hypothetical protein ACLU4J_19560 [Butyricimonas paravirosa]